MSEVIEFALLGLGTGAVYALAAIGLVVVYRASGVVNFASGAMGAIAAFIFYNFRADGMSVAVAMAIALTVGGAIGAATQYLVMRRLRNASPLAKLIVTLGLFTGLEGVALAKWGSNIQLVPPLFPETRVSFGGGIGVSEDRLWLFGIAVALVAALYLVYNRTLFGLATSAVAENRRAASGLGWSSNRIELLNWTVGGVLYALSAILLTPIVGLDAATLSGLILPALAAALTGRFASFPLTLAGGLLLGVAESELERYVSVTGVSSSAPFLVIAAVIVAGGSARPTRGDLPARLPLPGSGKIRWSMVAAGLILIEIFVCLASPLWVDAAITTIVTAILVLSVVVVTGMAGQLSLCQWALAGVGALFAGRLVAGAGLPFWAAAIIGSIATVPVGMIVAVPALRTRGVNLGVVTLALAVCIENVVLSNSSLTGGFAGTTVGSPKLFGLDVNAVSHPGRYATMAVIVLTIVSLAMANVRRGAIGRRLLAVRSNERVAATLGISVYGVKLYAFAVAALIAGIAGVLTAFQNQTLVFTGFDVFGSINAVVYAVVGGVGWVSGALVGGLMVPSGLVATAINQLANLENWLPVLSGALLILTLMWAPEGVASLNAEAMDAVRARVKRLVPRRIAVAQPGTHGNWLESASGWTPDRAPGRPITLSIHGLTVRYGGVLALNALDFTARPGEVTGVIGANGAGKTTLLDAINGFAKPDGGTVSLNDQIINEWSVERRGREGLSRAFQAVELFPEMTVGENLLVAAERPPAGRYLTDLVRPGPPRVTPLMREVVAELELEKRLDSMPAALPHGTARLAGIARALVSDARVLLLDEPAAGLDSRERQELGTLIVRVARERNIAVVLIEHDVDLVLRVCDRITVLDFGRRIAEGVPAEIQQNQAVIDAYMGAAPAVSNA